jgi:hypothetical protein
MLAQKNDTVENNETSENSETGETVFFIAFPISKLAA